MAKEFNLTFVKDDGMGAGLDAYVRERILSAGLKIVFSSLVQITPAQAAVHYDKDDVWCERFGKKRHAFMMANGGTEKTPLQLGHEILESVRAQLCARPVRLFLVYGENANDVMREIGGCTNPSDAAPGTIRAISTDSFAKADVEMRPVRNVVHISECEADAKRELLNLIPELITLLHSITTDGPFLS